MVAQFSILIAHYNNSNFFLDCFKSINEQTVQNFEVVIVDDFSSGEEFIKICKLIENDKRFKIYRNEFNKGVGFTKRRLVELASCEICGFLDPDDTLVNSALEIMLKKHLEYPNASLINSNLNFCNENLDIIKQSEIEQVSQFQFDFFNLRGNISHFATFKKSKYSETEGISEYFQIAEDQDLYLKLYEVGECIQINDCLYNYRSNPNSITNKAKQEITNYWKWVVIINTAQRRNINIENIFVENFITSGKVNQLNNKNNLLRKSRWLKLGYKLGLFNAYKYLK